MIVLFTAGLKAIFDFRTICFIERYAVGTKEKLSFNLGQISDCVMMNEIMKI